MGLLLEQLASRLDLVKSRKDSINCREVTKIFISIHLTSQASKSNDKENLSTPLSMFI
jgi:hypothetical protein